MDAYPPHVRAKSDGATIDEVVKDGCVALQAMTDCFVELGPFTQFRETRYPVGDAGYNESVPAKPARLKVGAGGAVLTFKWTRLQPGPMLS